MNTLKGRDILCLAAAPWDPSRQGMSEILTALAGQGNRILVIEPAAKGIFGRGFRKVRENLYVYTPGRGALRVLPHLRAWMQATGFHNPVIWSFLYEGIAPRIAARIEHSALIFHCLTDFKKPPRNNTFIRACTLVFAQSDELRAKCAVLNPRSYTVPFGVSPLFFAKEIRRPHAMEHVKKPVIGYTGPLDESLNLLLIRQISHIHPEWSLVLAGPAYADLGRIKTLPNIHIINCHELHHLPGYVRAFDAGMIPCAGRSPGPELSTLIGQYHAMGIPVVSTRIPAAVSFNKASGELVRIAETPAQFIQGIEEALTKDLPELKEKRIHCARSHEWPERIDEMSRLIETELEKAPRTPADWQKTLRARRIAFWLNACRPAAAAAVLYLILCHTPLVWALASFLKVSQPLEKADAAAVLMEEGGPEVSYEELVPYAAALYKNGYAPRIIFSSTGTKIFTEAMRMRDLALSLGVPQEAIILESKARTMPDKAAVLAGMGSQHSWRKILLVTSPYSTRRAQRAVAKAAPGLAVRCAPPPHTLYYERPSPENILARQVNLRQLTALVWEAFAFAAEMRPR